MAVTQIRGGVSEGLRVGDGSARRDRPLFPVLQQRATAPESWLPDAGSDPPGGVTFMNGATKRRSAFLESGTLPPNPWDLTLLGRNVWRTVEGTRTEDRAPQGCDPSAGSRAGMATGGFDAEAAPKLQTRPRRILAYCGRKMVLTMGSTSPFRSRLWPMRWVWNSSVIPNVGNTRSQPESAISSVGYPTLSTLRSKLPLVQRY